MSLGITPALRSCVLRITTQRFPDSSSLKLEGSVKGPWVDELQKAWLALPDKRKTINVDLSGVSFVDAGGRDLLLTMQREGGVLKGASGFLQNILEQRNGKSKTLRDRSTK